MKEKKNIVKSRNVLKLKSKRDEKTKKTKEKNGEKWYGWKDHKIYS